MHRWEITFEELWPGDLPMEISDQHNEKEFIRRAHVFPNGDLLGVFEYIGIFKLDRDSNVLWKRLESSPFLVSVGDPPALPGRPPEFDVSGST